MRLGFPYPGGRPLARASPSSPAAPRRPLVSASCGVGVGEKKVDGAWVSPRRRTPQFCPLGRRRLAGRIRPMREGEITARAQVGRPARSRALKAGRGPFWAVSATSSTLIFSLVYLLLCSNVFTLLFIHLLIDLG